MKPEPSLETLEGVGCVRLGRQHLHYEIPVINSSGLEWDNVWRGQTRQECDGDSGLFIDYVTTNLAEPRAGSS